MNISRRSSRTPSLPHTGPNAVTLKPAEKVSTAPVVAVGLIGGWLTARETGIRPLGGVVLAAAGIWAGRTWLARRGPATTAVLGATYLLGFGLSHPLAKKIGAWPAVLTVAGVSAGASALLSDAAYSEWEPAED
ncbi:hypothetical protein [Brachybacterium sp. p3-SID957]|uniref:hypothetical protein n=1 Tax=Brachybacterium sp. p3-SID957 TaxID=2916049 RepID=UPI00223AB099|nr:hypothetical protein [Brachybacterium sp. p3-SID957]MCT1777085.1 hypothetical protein [Brachybacterium sp. p3-SID957]